MTANKLIVATRKSRLAMLQTEDVCRQIEASLSGQVQCEALALSTTGDEQLEQRFSAFVDKAVFTKELDDALLAGRADFAVHSLKDIPSNLPQGLCLAGASPCLDGRDAFLSYQCSSLQDLPHNAVVGTSSSRRTALIKVLRPDLVVELLRGNVETRIRKLREGHYDAIVLSAAGLIRMGLAGEVKAYLDPFLFVPSVGQGTMGYVCRADDLACLDIITGISDLQNLQLLQEFRVVMDKLQGGCSTPLGIYGRLENDFVKGAVFLSSLEGRNSIRLAIDRPITKLQGLGQELFALLIQAGAQDLVQAIRGL